MSPSITIVLEVTSDALQLIEIGARVKKISIPEYVRDLVMDGIAKIDLEEALSPGALE